MVRISARQLGARGWEKGRKVYCVPMPTQAELIRMEGKINVIGDSHALKQGAETNTTRSGLVEQQEAGGPEAVSHVTPNSALGQAKPSQEESK